jgi:hypothetical protein
MLATDMFFWWTPSTVSSGGDGGNDQSGLMLGMNTMAFNRHMLWAIGSLLCLEISKWMLSQRLF